LGVNEIYFTFKFVPLTFDSSLLLPIGTKDVNVDALRVLPLPRRTSLKGFGLGLDSPAKEAKNLRTAIFFYSLLFVQNDPIKNSIELYNH
jgi:hypothetical protein